MTNMRRWIDATKLLTEAGTEEISEVELFSRFPGIESDLISVHEWMDGAPIKLRLVIERMAKFEEEAQSLLDTYPEFPKDKRRVNRISRAIQQGAKQWPIFVDNHDFIMEGRHRLVAFYVLGISTVPARKLSCVVHGVG